MCGVAGILSHESRQDQLDVALQTIDLLHELM
jgi:hypothetical protein